MPTRQNRRRLEIEAAVYEMLKAEAEWLHIPIGSCATMLIREAIAQRSTDKPYRNSSNHPLS